MSKAGAAYGIIFSRSVKNNGDAATCCHPCSRQINYGDSYLNYLSIEIIKVTVTIIK
jgi:hypothetical protein